MNAPGQAAVVITTYNHARFLAEAIDSVRNQTVAPAEIVVVDDGSDDAPERVVERYDSVRFIRQDHNRGPSAARNTGWRATSSEFVTFLDADDWLRPNTLEVGLRQLEPHPQAALTYGAYVLHYWPSGRIVEAPYRPVAADAFSALLHRNTIGMHATVLYRRSALEQANGFAEDLRASEDYDLYLRLARDHPIVCCPDVLAEYRRHDQNTSRDHAFMLRGVMTVMRRIAPDARARGLIDDWQAGTDHWKEWYIEKWAGQLSEGGLNAESLRLSASMFPLAPAQMLKKAAGGMVRQLMGRRSQDYPR